MLKSPDSMKVNLLIPTFLYSTILLSGCATTSKPINWTELKIQQGVTSQNDVTNILGQPLSYNRSFMRYSTYKYKTLSIKLTYIEDDGDVFEYYIHPNLGNDNLDVHLDENDIVRSISVS